MAIDTTWQDVRVAARWPAMILMVGIALATGAILGAVSLAVPHSGLFAALWLPNAAIVGLALSSRRQDLGAILIGASGGLAVGELVGGVAMTPGIALTVVNTVEIALAVMLTRRWCEGEVDFTDPKVFFRFVGAMLLAATASATLTGISAPLTGIDWTQAPMFLARHASSLLFVGPLAMVAIAAWRDRGRPRALVPTPVLGLVLAGSIAIFAQSSFPFLFLATPFVVLAGISSGIGGTAFVLVLMAIVATVGTAMGSGPMMLTRGEAALQFVSLQLFLASLTVVGLPLAGLIERGRRDRDAIRASHDEKRHLLDNIDEVVFLIGNDGTWQNLNAAWERITGLPIENSLDQPYNAFLPPRERDRIGAEMARLRSGLIPAIEMELYFERPDGEARHIETRMRCTYDDGGRPTGVIGHILDVTEKASGRLALEAREREFATLAELAPAGLYRTNARGECTWVNPAWLESTGMKDGQWQGSGWADAIHPDDFDNVYYEFNAAVAERRRFDGEWRWLRPDGSIVWVASAGAPQFDGEWRLLGYIGINMDITHVRQAKAELAERDRRLKTITDNLRDPLFMLGPDGSCHYASPFAGQMFGVAPDTLVGRDFAALFGTGASAAISERLSPLWHGSEQTCAFQFQPTGPDGAEGPWIDAHFSTVRAGGKVEAVIASIRDISDAKRLETDLHRARRKAEHAAQAKAGFLANMSHEIRTPMNGVIGFTELLLDSDLSDRQRRHAQLIADSGRSMMRLLNDILDMSKIDSGNLTIVPAPVDLRAKIATCVGLMQPVASRNGIALRSVVDDDVPKRLVSDPLRLRQILLNLIGNAVKFTEQGEVCVGATVERGSRGEDALTITVADTGIGIPPERIGDIFGQFRQADSSIARRYGGTGLGLAISSQLARLMGGDITVVSQVGVGTTFTVRIPLHVAEDHADAATTGSSATASLALNVAEHAMMPQMGDEPARVLVAEDNDINQELVLAMARRAGVNPDLAEDGAEAVRMVEAAHLAGRPYRLVLMDIQMPEMDGLEATRRIREAGFSARDLPIVALTANCFPDDIAACRRAGMQGHLAKPLQIAALNQAISMYLADVGLRQRRPVRQTVLQSSPAPVIAGVGAEDDLAVRYRERKAKLLTELAEVAAGKGEPEWDVLAMQLHKLAGTAGYFGDERLGELARALEDRLRSAQDGASRCALVRFEWETIAKVA